jgi:hippurate hydrolase
VQAAVASALEDYRWFHRHPELSNQEKQTAARLASSLRELGMEVREGVGGHGLVGVLRGGKSGEGPVVLYRADMDALPVTEQTGLPYESQTPGVMHACGHDVHMAVALGALRVMHGLRSEWSGTLLFVAQPAEELGAGAAQMLEDPQFSRLLAEMGKPRVAFALHDSADLPAGRVAVSGGYVTANVDSVDLTFHGKGGHGAKPHETIDPIVMASEAVMQLQTIVSRRVPPDRPAVVTVGQLRAGTKHNVIPPSAELLLTVRSYDDEIRALLLSEIRHVAESVAKSYHAPRPPDFGVREGHTPSGLNDVAWSERLKRRFSELLGSDQVVPIPPTMGGEDFARFGRQLGIPGVQWRLGAAEPGALARAKPGDLPGLHSDAWAPDVATALPVGVRTAVAALLEGFAVEGR